MKKKKISKIIIGSNNQGKIKEIRDLLPKNIKIYTPKQLNIKSPKEVGKTFRQNSLIKAKYFSNKSKLPCISDDSGLAISILDGAPGIKSARWGGTNGNFNLAIKKVYNKINQININWDKKKIRAKFICALTIYRTDHKYITSIGIINGIISKKKRGKYGFGYDPIFIPDGSKLTFGQMNPKKKYKIDHRAKAFKKIKKFL
tara:strand:- start:4838 stop:5440 length:603 start_codon:yes stop_codon:yes gene_type:complete